MKVIGTNPVALGVAGLIRQIKPPLVLIKERKATALRLISQKLPLLLPRERTKRRSS
jgi:hypothetical protein